MLEAKLSPVRSDFIVLFDNEREVLRVKYPDGSVEFGEGATQDEVSRLFWKYLGGFLAEQVRAAGVQYTREAEADADIAAGRVREFGSAAEASAYLAAASDREGSAVPAGVRGTPDMRDPLDLFLFKWAMGEDELNTDDFKQAKSELLAAIAAHGVGDTDGMKCRYTDQPGGACWRQGKAVELCTCHGMSEEAFKASVAAHAAWHDAGLRGNAGVGSTRGGEQ